MKNKISVITPSFNQAPFIEKTIQSVLNQQVENMEYWVIDGGSTDETLSILKKYPDKLQWISEKDDGQADAVNKGIQRMQGEIIAWINSDDVYYPDAFQKVLDYFETHPDVDIVYGNADYIDADDKIINSYPVEAWNFKRLKEVCYIAQPATFFRRRVVERIGLLNQKLYYCMDYEYWLRLGLAGVKFHYLSEMLAGSRLHSNCKTVNFRLQAHKEINEMMKQLFGKVPASWIAGYAYTLVVNGQYPQETSNINQKFLALKHAIQASLYWNQSVVSFLFYLTKKWFTRYFR